MANKITVKFTDNTVQVTKTIESAAIKFLEEAKATLASQAAKNSPVDSGDLKRSFTTDSLVVDSEFKAYIGSSLEYAIYQEYGTGEYALQGNGRKDGWIYKSKKDGKYYFTRGTAPKRMLYRAFQTKKEAVKKRGQDIFKGLK